MKTFWTNLNPEKRFISCPRHQNAGGCNFFDWCNPLMCARSKELIFGFLWIRREMEAGINTLRSRNRSAWKTWLIGFVCGVFMNGSVLRSDLGLRWEVRFLCCDVGLWVTNFVVYGFLTNFLAIKHVIILQ